MFFSRKNIKSLTDLELIEAYCNAGNEKAFGVLFDRYMHLIYGVCLKYLRNEAESRDAVMLIFEKLMVDLKTNDITNFRPWLHTVARNHCLMFLRKNKKVVARETDFETIDPYLAAPIETNAAEEKEVQLNHLEAAIEQLKPDQKQCIELFYLKDVCYSDIAEMTGFTLKQVKSHLQNGKRNLKNMLATKNEFSVRK